MDTNVAAPPREELVAPAAKLVPLLKQHAQWMEDNRRLHDEVVEALVDGGFTRLRVPARYGGYEADTRTVVDVIAELGRGDGSTAWTVAVWSISTFMAGLFPDEVQDEVFADPGTRICGILGPSALGRPVDGGIVLNGKWTFNSGVQQSDWNTNAAVMAMPDGSHAPIMVAIPTKDLQIVDDWHTSGLRASGSVSTIAQELFVPAERVLQMVPVLQGRHESRLNADSPVFRALFMPTACATVSAAALGLARAARDAFFERLPGRKITYTAYEDQSQAPITHLQAGEAITRLNEAEFHVHRLAATIDTKAAAGAEWTLEERAAARLHTGAAVQRAREAVDVLARASGGSSIYRDVPIQRIKRDMDALSMHAIMHPETNLELYGRIACGLEPNTVYI
jgi:3-hydroxy-9,10-secoandrosta-1,3,5(10)-triene-9,17-dione monooxygenase